MPGGNQIYVKMHLPRSIIVYFFEALKKKKECLSDRKKSYFDNIRMHSAMHINHPAEIYWLQ